MRSNKRGIHPQHLHDYVIKPACMFVDGRYRPEVAQLLMGTCAQESQMGRFLQQLGNGPAIGIFQMEQPAYQDVWVNYLKYRDGLANRVRVHFGAGALNHDQLRTDMLFAAVMCRLDYKREPKAIPAFGDIAGLAAYWKDYWNSKLGKGTVAEFGTNWNHFNLNDVEYC